jgi:hypothetical protein
MVPLQIVQQFQVFTALLGFLPIVNLPLLLLLFCLIALEPFEQVCFFKSLQLQIGACA